MLKVACRVQENGNWGVDQAPSSSMNTGKFQCAANQGGGFSVSMPVLAPHWLMLRCAAAMLLCMELALCVELPVMSGRAW